jgi:TPR repeat protein
MQAENYCFDADALIIGSRGNKQSVQQAIELYEKSAELGNAKAMMALGRIYELGIGVKPNPEASFDYYERAAALNVPYALYQLGYSCETKKH